MLAPDRILQQETTKRQEQYEQEQQEQQQWQHEGACG
jgi:hypothetical protein